jgi:3',5'-nucleoside bisphosphate phosphatase
MRVFRADLHIHTVLSPCGDLDMSPANIVSKAVQVGLDIIGITDHNTTRHCQLISRLAAEKGFFVMQGAEVTTKEEVHCLAFFENTDALNTFQEFLDANLSNIPNDPSIFGHQVQVDEHEMIIYKEKKLLINAIAKTIKEVEDFVHDLDGLFIPAHIDRKKNSIYSQLGFLPENMKADALEISKASSPEKFSEEHSEILDYRIIRSSDAHYPKQIGSVFTNFYMETASFQEIKMAIKGVCGRNLEVQ